ARLRPAYRRDHAQVLPPTQVRMGSRLLDDGSHARERLGPPLRHRQSEQPHAALAGAREAQQHPNHRGLARAVGAEEAEGATAWHFEVHGVDREALAEALRQPARGYYRGTVLVHLHLSSGSSESIGSWSRNVVGQP